MNRNNKKLLIVSFAILICASVLSGCKYEPPEGYTKNHHTYNDLLEYAKSIDPNASVTDDPKDVNDEYWIYRVYPAVINGIECNVVSRSDVVYDSTWGEFGKKYYKMDTDYDYYIVNELLSKYPDLGTLKDDSESTRFQVNDILYTTITENEMSSEKLESLFKEYVSINEELEEYPIHKSYWVDIYVNDHHYRFTSPTAEEKQKVYDKMVEDGVI